jgi:branched-subunit amino acid permease
MKKVKWHKFLVVAFMIWAGNKVVALIGGVFRPYAIAIILFLIIVIFESCSSCGRSKRYWKNHRCVEHTQTFKNQIVYR